MKSKSIQSDEINKFPKRWHIKILQNVTTLITDGKHGDCKNQNESGYYFLSAKDVKNGNLEYSNARQITKQDFIDSHKRTQLELNDVLLTNSGTIGRLALVKNVQKVKHTTFQKSVAIIKPDKHVLNSHFLYYYLLINTNHINEIASGTAQQNLLLKDLRNFKIVVPMLNIQKKIVNHLYNIDLKIENLQNQNKILKQMVQAIFKSWFVDFDGITEFENSELGKIPKMWRIVKLSDFITLQKGISYKGKYLENNGNPMINLGNISKNGGFINHKIKYYTGKFKTHHTINSHDIVIANTDITQDRLVLGSAAIIPPLNQKTIIFTHHLFGVINHSKLGNYFLYHLFQTIRYRQNVTSYAIGTTVLAIHKEAILDFKFPFIKGNIFQKFEKIAASIYKLIINNNMKIENLVKIRDTLLPKLMSGEIQV